MIHFNSFYTDDSRSEAGNSIETKSLTS